MMEKIINKIISRKFLGTIITSGLLMFGVDISPELQAQLQTALWAVYVFVQGYVDSKPDK